MRRRDAQALARLPVTATPWEVALVDVPVTVAGVETEGLLLVAEQSSGLVRAAGPIVRGRPLLSVLEGAFRSPPAPCVPARPPRVLCDAPDVLRRLVAELAGTGIRVDRVDRLRAIDQAIAGLAADLDPFAAPGITADPRAWSEVLEALARGEPWARVPGVRFRFEGAIPELVGTVAVLSSEPPGVVLLATEADHRRFADAVRAGDPDPLAGVESSRLSLEPVDGLPAREAAACRSAGLVTRAGLAPRLVGSTGDQPQRLTARGEAIMLAAVRAIVAVTAAWGDAAGVRTLDVPTALGSVRVRATPAEKTVSDGLVAFDHAVAVGSVTGPDGRPQVALLVKGGRREVERLARALASLDRVEIVRGGPSPRLRAWAGVRALGDFVYLPSEADAGHLAREGRVVVCLAAGGARRAMRPSDPVATFEVAVTEDGVRRRGHDAVFDRPPAEWPKASAVLLEFGEPFLDGGRLPPDVLRPLLDIVATVWSAVVLANHGADPSLLRDLRERLASSPVPMVEVLVERKRRLYAGDPRLFVVDRVESRATGPHVFVTSSLPSGVTLGR